MIEENDPRVIGVHTMARLEFEQFAGNNGEEVADPVNDMQIRLMRWQRDRFGLQTDRHDLLMTLGVIEELGEAFTAPNGEEALDGLGDVIVYAGQLAMANRLALSPIVRFAEALDPLDATHQEITGRLAHVVLKASQRIRGMDDEDRYRTNIVRMLALSIALAADTAYSLHFDHKIDIAKVYTTVGAEVLLRKRGDVMIPKETHAEHMEAAREPTDPAHRKRQAMALLTDANERLGEAERVEGPGDFMVADELVPQ